MNNIVEHYLIQSTASIKEALVAINQNSDKGLILFVQDKEGKAIGSLTDGDIRRGLILGYTLEDPVSAIMHKDFSFLEENDFNIKKIRRLKQDNIRLVPILDAQGRICDILNLSKKRSLLPIDAVLMAGGKGERLRPLTEETPKPLIKVGDKCIIDYNIDSLIAYGLNHIYVTINYLGEQLEEHFRVPRDGVKVNTIREPKYLGTIGSIKFVEIFYHDTILVMNSDLFTNIDYEDFYLHFKQNDADMSVAAVPYVVKVPYGVFNLEGRVIKGVTEKPTISYYANAGIYLIKKERLDLIPENEFFNATDFMELLIAKGYKVIRYPISGYWIDIGQHDELERAREIAKHISL